MTIKNQGYPSPFSFRNIRLFILFRVLFNARFYYPVFSVLFLDYGLTLSQFALLNTVWAATIVLAEIPSGALADILGRTILLRFAGSLMVIELLLLMIVPIGASPMLFYVFLINRILSGLAEAAASGADEALAYDTLALHDMTDRWPEVLKRQMQAQSCAFLLVMVLGAVVYDPSLMQTLVMSVGMNLEVTRETVIRLPVLLSLINALVLWAALWFLQEPKRKQQDDTERGQKTVLLRALSITWETAVWVTKTPFVAFVILFGLLLDASARMLITMASQYYRLIEIPEAWFGVLGALLALLGFATPSLAHWLGLHKEKTVLAFLGGMTFLGLIGMSYAWPTWGLLPAVLVFSQLSLVGFLTSHYLNERASSARRATALSFKGLAFNMGYGAIGIFYALLLSHLQKEQRQDEAVKTQVFAESLGWFPWSFLIVFLFLVVFAYLSYRKSTQKTG